MVEYCTGIVEVMGSNPGFSYLNRDYNHEDRITTSSATVKTREQDSLYFIANKIEKEGIR